MDNTAFLTAYNMSRNGCNDFYKHSMVSNFVYSDGVRDCFIAGCYWLGDVAATELPAVMRANKAYGAMLEVHVKDRKGTLKLTVNDESPPIWKRKMDFIDMPDGVWTFELTDEGSRVAMTLISEH